MSRVAVVTDSAADLPGGLASSENIEVVPLTVRFGDREFRDGRDLPMKRFWSRVEAGEVPTTASPSPGELLDLYRAAAERGAGGIVSVHVSRFLSRTVETASLAAREAPVPVTIVDSRAVSLGQALVALAASRSSQMGADREAVAAAAESAAAALTVCAFVDTVEFLQRGGRVGRAKAAISELLKIRPVLTLDEGEPVVASRARTRGRAIREILDRSSRPAVACAVFHAQAPEADAVASALAESCGVYPLVGEIGSVTGTHLGPRSLGVAVVRR